MIEPTLIFSGYLMTSQLPVLLLPMRLIMPAVLRDVRIFFTPLSERLVFAANCAMVNVPSLRSNFNMAISDLLDTLLGTLLVTLLDTSFNSLP